MPLYTESVRVAWGGDESLVRVGIQAARGFSICVYAGAVLKHKPNPPGTL